MKVGINTKIAYTYMVSKIKSTLVAALGVTFGIGMFIFMNSLITGTNEYSEKTMLSATPHIRLYNDNKISNTDMLNRYIEREEKRSINLISNPQLVPQDNRIINPEIVVAALRKRKEVIALSTQVNANIIYSKGNVQENGTIFGVNIAEQDKMFDITSNMIAGKTQSIANNPNNILIGIGLSRKLNLKMGDYVRITASNGLTKTLQVSGIFKTTIKNVDETKTYVSTPVVQQLLQKDRAYITDIYVNIKDYSLATETGNSMAQQTGYTSESWQQSNEQSLAGKKIRDIIANSVIFTILLVAGFGIYNILNMVIYEKIKEIAILKATGFQGSDVVSIFIQQALLIGLVGATMGLVVGWLISYLLSRLYLGLGNVTYLPMTFLTKHYIQGAIFGLLTSFFAGYIPARKASQVDPVSIIRG
ncbi:ABC transporter permease [Chitinophaga sancti]|uniref:FtsX-like permease family protein n=1 Tax=Chitinophaga sancti TaxID=1004 RepID=A0A1K1S5H4_9BACT|nr:FtsX-like permease family protein [Chitinophaga sancti]WQD63704.1 FtsX-like permease family protein [Chitinophaga sancti]WQG90671.1 FtsX-like permease family protein [Chitinophaga sancti]SFW79269.1 lipoprotein-releasing system permease protein [Chitinophaga sancti]